MKRTTNNNGKGNGKNKVAVRHKEFVNQCLGNDPVTGNRCNVMLPKGAHICNDCRRRIDTAGKKASKISSGNGSRRGNLLCGTAE